MKIVNEFFETTTMRMDSRAVEGTMPIRIHARLLTAIRVVSERTGLAKAYVLDIFLERALTENKEENHDST